MGKPIEKPLRMLLKKKRIKFYQILVNQEIGHYYIYSTMIRIAFVLLVFMLALIMVHSCTSIVSVTKDNQGSISTEQHASSEADSTTINYER